MRVIKNIAYTLIGGVVLRPENFIGPVDESLVGDVLRYKEHITTGYDMPYYSES